MIQLSREGDVFVLTMDAEENRWNTNFVRAFDARLDEIEASEGAAALVTTSSNPKFFSNGLDIAWVQGPDDGEGGDRSVFGVEFMNLMGRIVGFPIPTVAAVNGHAFGAGFMLALCHDVRFMREDRGFLCANEIQLGLRIPDAELELFRHKMSASAFFETVQLARRWTGTEARDAGFVQHLASFDDIVAHATVRAEQLAPLGTNRELYAESKERIFGEAPSIRLPSGAAHQLRTVGR